VHPPFRTFLCLPPFALAAGTLYLLARADLTGLDQESLPEPWPLMALDQGTGDEIEWLGRRMEVKRQVTRALIDGRLTFRQAAARFREINASLGGKVRCVRSPEYTEEEWPYRQVIFYVHNEFATLRGTPARAEEWVRRLEAELPAREAPAGKGGLTAACPFLMEGTLCQLSSGVEGARRSAAGKAGADGEQEAIERPGHPGWPPAGYQQAVRRLPQPWRPPAPPGTDYTGAPRDFPWNANGIVE
jgi:hypothetical protein